MQTAETIPRRIIPERGKSFEDSDKAASSKVRAVLDEDPRGLTLTDDALEFEPESGALATEAFACTRRRDILTREAATNDVHLTL